ncbi:flagellar export chaperone FliS [Frateuria aurantia]
MAYPRRQAVSLYQQNYAAGSVEGADPHRLTGLLYDALLEAVQQARGHMQRQDMTAKGRSVTRSIRILEALRAGLDPSVTASRLPARLGGLYSYLIGRLLQAHLHNDPEPLDETVRLITPLREAWQSIREQYLQQREAGLLQQHRKVS